MSIGVEIGIVDVDFEPDHARRREREREHAFELVERKATGIGRIDRGHVLRIEHVDVEVEKKALLLRVGAAIGLGVAAAPAAAAVPLIAPGSEEEKQCAPLLAEVGKARRTGETRPSGKPVEKR